MTIVVLTGASGSGKTAIALAIALRRPKIKVFHFDSIGVPPFEQMIACHGSGEAWQRAQTINWMRRLAQAARTFPDILFEGQTRFSFLAEGAAAAGDLIYSPILVDCDDATRVRRLEGERNQPELANADMLNWALHLRREAFAQAYPVLDNSTLTLAQCVEWVMRRFDL